MSRTLAILSVTLLLGGTAAPTVIQEDAPAPSLDQLYSRAATFWELLAERDRNEAASFLLDDTEQDAFRRQQQPPFENPRVEGIDLTGFPERATVRLRADLLQFGQVFPWSIEQDWVYREGDWFLDFEPVQSRSSFAPTRAEPDANERLIEAFREGFELEPAEIVIPDDAFGRNVQGELDYRYTGEGRFNMEVVDGPDVLSVNRIDLLDISEGEGKIRYAVIGDRLFSNDLPDLVLRTTLGEATAEFTVPVRWDGTPRYRWQWSPRSVAPGFEGEVVLSLENIDDGTWMPGAVSVEGVVETVSTPQGETVRPGETAVYRLRTTEPVQAPPIVHVPLGERLLSISLPIVLPEEDSEAGDGLTRERLEELLRNAPSPQIP